MFLQVCVCPQGGMAGGMHGKGAMCGWGACMVGRGHVWQGVMCGRGACVAGGACMVGGGGCAWQGGVHGRGWHACHASPQQILQLWHTAYGGHAWWGRAFVSCMSPLILPDTMATAYGQCWPYSGVWSQGGCIPKESRNQKKISPPQKLWGESSS